MTTSVPSVTGPPHAISIAHEARLPLGHRVSFRWSGASDAPGLGELAVIWSPDPPRPRSERQRRRLARADIAERARFLVELSAAIAAPILIFDAGGESLIIQPLPSPETPRAMLSINDVALAGLLR